MSDIQLGEIDLNLLVVLHHLLATGNATRTADRLGRTPSAVSHALRRLRSLLDDPLFVRVGGHLEPTPHALSLAPGLENALRGLEGVVSAGKDFDPATASRSFSIGAVDYHELVLLPRLAASLAQQAPGIAIQTMNPGDDVERQVQSGSLDLAVCVAPRELPGLRQRTLFRESFVVAMRKDHPLAKGRLTLRRFASARHVVVAPRGKAGSRVGDALAQKGLSRQVPLRTVHFVTAPLVVAQTDLVLTLPRRVAEALAEPHGLALFKPPVELPDFTVVLIYGEPFAQDPAHQWLRDRIAEAAGRRPR